MEGWFTKNIKDLGPMAAALAALLSTLITATIGWLKDRGEGAKRLSRIEDAEKRVAFVQAWSDARIRLAPNETSTTQAFAIEQLDAIFSEFKLLAEQHAAEPVQAAKERRSSVGWLRKVLLLYLPVRGRAWVPRIFFYVIALDTVLHPIFNWHEGEIGTFLFGAGILLVLFWGISKVME
jgi:hypothetical protein